MMKVYLISTMKKKWYKKKKENHFYNKKKMIIVFKFLITIGRLHISNFVLNHSLFQDKD